MDELEAMLNGIGDPYGGIDFGSLTDADIAQLFGGDFNLGGALDTGERDDTGGLNGGALNGGDPQGGVRDDTGGGTNGDTGGAHGGGIPNVSGGLAGILRGLGITGGGGAGGSDLMSILPLLMAGIGGLTANRATSRATDQMVNAAHTANDQATGAINGASAAYKPWQDAGLGALAKMQAQPPSNIAGQFRPLGSGRSLASLVRH